MLYTLVNVTDQDISFIDPAIYIKGALLIELETVGDAIRNTILNSDMMINHFVDCPDNCSMADIDGDIQSIIAFRKSGNDMIVYFADIDHGNDTIFDFGEIAIVRILPDRLEIDHHLLNERIEQARSVMQMNQNEHEIIDVIMKQIAGAYYGLMLCRDQFKPIDVTLN